VGQQHLPGDDQSGEEAAASVVALAGRRVDAVDARVPRFPQSSIQLVRDRLRTLFTAERVETLVCSAACGADLLALEMAQAMAIQSIIVLPFARVRFRESSVVDRPGPWGELFDRILDNTEATDSIIELTPTGSDHEAYASATTTILDRALALTEHPRVEKGAVRQLKALAVVVWDGEPRGPDDLTDMFAKQANARGFQVHEVLTQ
jgi:hypothetical protein